MRRPGSIIGAAGALALAAALLSPPPAGLAASQHRAINCAEGQNLCAEVADPSAFGGYYVGHDEPSVLFYSSRAGSGNDVRYQLTLPSDPPSVPLTADTSFNFELHPAFWFGMAMCDTQSYPEQISTCTPDSDSNILDPAVSPKHAGAAFTELQFYPPGWVGWPQNAGSCDPVQWCVALNIDSFMRNPVTGQDLNTTCQSLVSIEPVNFAFLTRDGQVPSGAPPNPVQSTVQTFTPDRAHDLFMSSGDSLVVTMHDTAHGLQTDVQDLTSGAFGTMTASAANGFGQVQFAPAPSTACTNIPFDFHPMYSTSSEQTRVPWTAHSYNIAFADEIGHFDFCSNVLPNGGCSQREGSATDLEISDKDDNFCFRPQLATQVQVSGCTDTNTGFDGVPYQRVWPDGNTVDHPTPILFSSPVTGPSFNQNYDRVAFEADLPRVEASDFKGPCDRSTGSGCTRIPVTDDGVPASFYPFFSTVNQGGACRWAIGNDLPVTTSDFGKNDQYGPLLFLDYLVVGGGGAVFTRTNDFRQVLSFQPCPQ
jgi:hypothetical protein